MFERLVFVLGFISFICFVKSVDVSSFITKCKINDASCIKASSQKALPTVAVGLPEFNMESLDPMRFDHLDASKPNLKFAVDDLIVNGLKKCEVLKSEISGKKFHMVVLCDVVATSKYILDGTLIRIPIKGNSDLYINLKKFEVTVDFTLNEKNGKDGKTHWKVQDITHSFKMNTKCDLRFENLFEDNELLGRAARELVANSSNDLFLELGPPIVKAIVQKIVTNVNRLFRNISLDDLVLN